MDVYLSAAEIGEIYSKLDGIAKVLAFAEGREDRYSARRENFRIIQFQSQETTAFFEFTEKEIQKMPKKAKNFFRLQGHTVHYRKRNTGRYRCSYEIYYSKKPYNDPPISASGTTPEEAKTRFIKKLNNYTPNRSATPVIPNDFHGFALYWFENFHKRKVAENTYKKNLATYKRDIQSAFAREKLLNITPVQLQNFIDGYSDKARTTETLRSLLHQILDCAVKHGILERNPIDLCFFQKHEREHGVALSIQEEKELLTAYADTDFDIDFAVALYTGLRPNEFATARIDGSFIVARNSKRKNRKEATKRIPITPMLRPYLKNIENLRLHCPDTITKRMKAVLPEHKLYDLRTTFQTRCTECRIAEVAIGLFMGNDIGGALKVAYTDVSDEWLIEEGKKLNY